MMILDVKRKMSIMPEHSSGNTALEADDDE